MAATKVGLSEEKTTIVGSENSRSIGRSPSKRRTPEAKSPKGAQRRRDRSPASTLQPRDQSIQCGDGMIESYNNGKAVVIEEEERYSSPGSHRSVGQVHRETACSSVCSPLKVAEESLQSRSGKDQFSFSLASFSPERQRGRGRGGHFGLLVADPPTEALQMKLSKYAKAMEAVVDLCEKYTTRLSPLRSPFPVKEKKKKKKGSLAEDSSGSAIHSSVFDLAREVRASYLCCHILYRIVSFTNHCLTFCTLKLKFLSLFSAFLCPDTANDRGHKVKPNADDSIKQLCVLWQYRKTLALFIYIF